MSLRPRAVVIPFATALLLVFCGVAFFAAGAAVADDPTTSFDTNTTMTVELQQNGDARWTITTTFSLDSANQTAAFQDLADDFTAEGETGLERTATLQSFEQAVSITSSATDREMNLSDVDRETELDGAVDNGTGELTLSFTWENFTRVDGNQLYIDDVLVTDQGLWLPGLEADQTLVIQAPSGGGVVDGNVPARNGELRWEGPATFDEDTLQSTFVGDTNGDGDNQTVVPPDNGNGDDDNQTEVPPDNGNDETALIPWIVGGGAVVVIAALAFYLFARRTGGLQLPKPASRDRSDGTTAEQAEEEEPTAATEPAAGDDTDETSAETQVIDEELLSDEERVRRLLEANGGRIKQAAIVKETDWSNAKVSQLLSGMHEDGRIDKLRIGRENLISFPEESLTADDDEN